MGNKNYEKGIRKERKIKKQLEMEGLTVLRTAGSHGFADLIAIDKEARLIRFIQCKPDNFSEKSTQKLLDEHSYFKHKPVFNVMFEVI